MKVDKSFSIKPFCNTNVYIWFSGVEALMKQDESQGCLKPSYVPSPYSLCLGKVDALRRGP